MDKKHIDRIPRNPGKLFACFSGKTEEHKLKLVGPDIFQRGGGLLRERVGDKKFGMSFKNPENPTFGLGIPSFLPGYLRGARKV